MMKFLLPLYQGSFTLVIFLMFSCHAVKQTTSTETKQILEQPSDLLLDLDGD